MADSAFILARAATPAIDFTRAALSLTVEPCLGMAKFRVHDEDPAARFKAVAGWLPPPARMQIEQEGLTIAWMSPAEWLIVGHETDVIAWLDRVADRGDDSSIALDISHARASFVLAGADARDALAAHCPLDLWENSFPVHSVARSLLGDTIMFIARLADVAGTPRFRIIVDQTMACYSARILACG